MKIKKDKEQEELFKRRMLDQEFDACPVCLHFLNSCYCETNRYEFQYSEEEFPDTRLDYR